MRLLNLMSCDMQSGCSGRQHDPGVDINNINVTQTQVSSQQQVPWLLLFAFWSKLECMPWTLIRILIVTHLPTTWHLNWKQSDPTCNSNWIFHSNSTINKCGTNFIMFVAYSSGLKMPFSIDILCRSANRFGEWLCRMRCWPSTPQLWIYEKSTINDKEAK